MKKYYLMAVAVLALASCNKEAVDYGNMSQAEKDRSIYNDNFRTYIGGHIDANQNWGFSDNLTKRGVTRGSNTNGNQWEDQGYILPAPITEEEIAKVKAVFGQKGAASYTSPIEFNDYFVQQVYKGDSVYKDKSGGTVKGSDKMDWLCAKTKKFANVICWYPYEEEIIEVDEYNDHFNNFNAGTCDANYTSQKTGTVITGTMLMTNSDTYCFGFKASQDNAHTFYNFRVEKIDDNYYVGFDFEADGQNPNEQVDRDYVYDDWIVKIVPGTGNIVTNLRIIAEDLNASGASDFDFNDVVLDVEMGNPAKVKVIAAGATLPIRINENDDLEVHKLLLGPDTEIFDANGKAKRMPMINTGAKADINNVPAVYVPNFAESIESAAEANEKIKLEVFKNGVWQELTAVKGEPACKLAVSTSFRIMEEKESLKESYPTFLEWAAGTNFRSKWW